MAVAFSWCLRYNGDKEILHGKLVHAGAVSTAAVGGAGGIDGGQTKLMSYHGDHGWMLNP